MARSVVAVIPARGGSKRIPRKNLVDLGGKPLIAHSIEWALQEEGVSRVIVSTDSDEIADAARRFGAEVPFKRPSDLASDLATDLQVFQHLLEWMTSNEQGIPEVFLQARPTTPFRSPGLSHRLLQALGATVTHVRTIRPAPVPPFKTYWRDDDQRIRPVAVLPDEPEAHNLPAQKLPRAWIHDGALDLVLPEVVRAGSMTGPHIVGILNDDPDSIDIDEPRDLAVARVIATERFRRSAVHVARNVRMLICDVDGTLTDGSVWCSGSGESLKRFSVRDGMGLSLLRDAGIRVAWVTKESSAFPDARGRKLQIDEILLGVHDKTVSVLELATKYQLTPEQLAFVGDDINDICAMQIAGFRACPLDAEPEVVALAHFVSTRPGGSGAVREICDFILAARTQASRT